MELSSLSVKRGLTTVTSIAVVKQSNNVNKLALMTAEQEGDSPVRGTLEGLCSVCDLFVTCAYRTKVSEVDKWVHMFLIGGINDEDTKQEVLSKVS